MAYSTNQHAEWLSLIEVSGPFLAEPVLNQAFPQGLEKVDSIKKRQFRQTYDEWREVIDSDSQNDIAIKDRIHQQWINWVLKYGLELDEDEDGDILKDSIQMNSSIQVSIPEHNITLKPEFAVIKSDDTPPYMLIQTYPAGTALSEVLKGDGWSTSPAERMAHLCRGVGTRLGLITNGEQWMFIDAPSGGITTYASWFARLWGLEPVTLKAFYSLFNIGIVFNGFDEAKSLPQLIDESLQHQDDVTQTLGTQVSRAVEVLIQSIDRINHDHNGELLEGVEPEELYEAGLTLMMRLVFLLCAEERGLLLLGDQSYEANYAISTLRAKLRQEASLHGEEVLSYRKNAWSRLLAIFRSVYAGVEHENMRMPALGGSLFDPDRFPFLEGRIKGSNWLEEEAKPLPIDNRTVLLFLDAIQLYQGRTLSYRALDVEQIGYVYEGLLEQTVKRAPDVTLELSGSKSCKKPWVYLGELASASLDGETALKKLLKERTASSPSRITNDLTKEVTDADVDKLMVACYNDIELCQRIKPYYHFLRFDAWGNPLLYPKGAYMLTTGSDRRETGSHYTPKSLTESIVTETLEPVVYIGPAEGKPRKEWQLKSPEELLNLKICDPAMGSGAFLVQVCRWLAERVCESWLIVEQRGAFITVKGVTASDETEELVPIDVEERLLLAKRLISERCLYGVDINPLAVELAKLSIWLVTLSKDRPFGFLDHNLKSGDSLLGIHNLDQLSYLNLNPFQAKKSKLVVQLFANKIKELVADTLKLRKQIASHDINSVTDIDEMALLEGQVREKILLPKLIADAFIGLTVESSRKLKDTTVLSSFVQQAMAGDEEALSTLIGLANRGLSTDLPERSKGRKAFHWVLEFPDVFISPNDGFDAFIGNPPFLGGRKIRGALGGEYLTYLTNVLENSASGNADLCAFFFLRAFSLLNNQGTLGFISTNSISEGDTKETGLQRIVNRGGSIYCAIENVEWPGVAAITVTIVHIEKLLSKVTRRLNGLACKKITSSLKEIEISESMELIGENKNLCFVGSMLTGKGFVLTNDKAAEIINLNEEYKNVIQDYYTGEEIFNSVVLKSKRKVINFSDWSLEEAQRYPIALEVLVEHVKPIRDTSNRKAHRERWWQYGDKRPALYQKLSTIKRALVQTRHTKHLAPQFVNTGSVFSDSTVVFPTDSHWIYAILNSRIHDCWAREVGGTIRQELRYSHTDCFYTFPFPEWTELVENLGLELELLRNSARSDLNLTVNCMLDQINDPNCNDALIGELRKLQMKTDKSILESYGWGDIELDYDFYTNTLRQKYTFSEIASSEIKLRLLKRNNFLAKNGWKLTLGGTNE